MAAGDVVIAVDLRIQGYRIMAGTVVLDGSNPTPVDLGAYMASVAVAQATIQGSVATGVDPNQVTLAVAAAILNVYAWKITTGGASGNPTELASTDNARLVNWLAIGPELPRKGS